jgi:hypothetical protein
MKFEPRDILVWDHINDGRVNNKQGLFLVNLDGVSLTRLQGGACTETFEATISVSTTAGLVKITNIKDIVRKAMCND